MFQSGRSMVDLMPVMIAIISGLCFGMIGVMVKAGHQRSITPLCLMFVPFVFGTLVFGAMAYGAAHNLPPLLVWGCGLGTGCAQYLALSAMRAALKLGPLSPLWCAANLSYVLPIPLAWLVLDERATSIQLLGCTIGVVGVVIGAIGQSDKSTQPSTSSVPHMFKYLMVLGALFALNSTPGIAVKLLNGLPLDTGVKYMSQYRWFFLFLLYGSAGVIVFCDLLSKRKLRAVFQNNTLMIGIVIAACSLSGMGLLSVAGRLPSAIVFPVNSAANMVSAAVISAIAFKERVSCAFIVMIICVLASAIMVNL